MSETTIVRDLNLDELTLDSGGHEPPTTITDAEMCVMEATSYVAGEEWSDHPKCVSPAIAAFLRSWNDSMKTEDRQKLKPYITAVIGTATTPEDEQIRAWMATDWLVRTFAPAWLDLANLGEHASALRALPELASSELAREAMKVINEARAAGAAAGAAARDAAWAAAWAAARAAARAAAWAAARDAAWAAARAAAWAAARDAAGAAARAAAWAAARDALAPTVASLQESAFELLDRMIAVGAK